MKALLMSVAAVALVASGSAHAGIEECSQPPYGGTMAQYRIITDQSFRSHLTELNVRKICEAKFGRRDDLRRLGISDAVIDGPMFELWMTMRQKFWEFSQQLPDEVKPKAGGAEAPPGELHAARLKAAGLIKSCWKMPAGAVPVTLTVEVGWNWRGGERLVAPTSVKFDEARYGIDPAYRASADVASAAVNNPRCWGWPVELVGTTLPVKLGP